MASILDTFESFNESTKKTNQSILDTFETPTSVKEVAPTNIMPVVKPKVNVDAYNVESLFGKIAPKAPGPTSEVSKAQHDLDMGPSYGAALALNRLWSLAKNPYDVIKGGAEFVSSLPGFALGVGGAAWEISKAIGKGANLDQAYMAAAKGMERMQEDGIGL